MQTGLLSCLITLLVIICCPIDCRECAKYYFPVTLLVIIFFPIDCRECAVIIFFPIDCRECAVIIFCPIDCRECAVIIFCPIDCRECAKYSQCQVRVPKSEDHIGKNVWKQMNFLSDLLPCIGIYRHLFTYLCHF